MAPAPYNPGHALTEVEANVLNQVFGENLRNNFASTIAKFRQEEGYGSIVDEKFVDNKQPLSAEHLDALRAEFAEYAKDYSFVNGGRGPRGPQDPVKDMAISLCTARVAAQALAKNIALTKARLKELAEKLFNAKPDEWRAKAEAELKKLAKNGDDLDAEFFTA